MCVPSDTGVSTVVIPLTTAPHVAVLNALTIRQFVSPLRIGVTRIYPRLNQCSNKPKRFRAEQPHLRLSELPVAGGQGVHNPAKGLPFTSLPEFIKEAPCFCERITSGRGGASAASKGYEKGCGVHIKATLILPLPRWLSGNLTGSFRPVPDSRFSTKQPFS